MRSDLLTIILILISFLNCENDVLSQISVADNKSLSQSQKDSFIKYVSGFPNGTQLSIAIITNNDVNYIGIKKVNNILLSINNKDSVFEIGSITK